LITTYIKSNVPGLEGVIYSFLCWNHSRKRCNVFGDARFLFCPNL